MKGELRGHLMEVAKDVQMRAVLTFFYRDQLQGAPFAGLKEMLFLHEDVEESRLKELVKDEVLTFDGTRYQLSAAVRAVLERDPTILTGESLR